MSQLLHNNYYIDKHKTSATANPKPSSLFGLIAHKSDTATRYNPSEAKKPPTGKHTKYFKEDRKGPSPTVPSSSSVHPKKLQFDDENTNEDNKRVGSRSSSKRSDVENSASKVYYYPPKESLMGRVSKPTSRNVLTGTPAANFQRIAKEGPLNLKVEALNAKISEMATKKDLKLLEEVIKSLLDAKLLRVRNETEQKITSIMKLNFAGEKERESELSEVKKMVQETEKRQEVKVKKYVDGLALELKRLNAKLEEDVNEAKIWVQDKFYPEMLKKQQEAQNLALEEVYDKIKGEVALRAEENEKRLRDVAEATEILKRQCEKLEEKNADLLKELYQFEGEGKKVSKQIMETLDEKLAELTQAHKADFVNFNGKLSDINVLKELQKKNEEKISTLEANCLYTQGLIQNHLEDVKKESVPERIAQLSNEFEVYKQEIHNKIQLLSSSPAKASEQLEDAPVCESSAKHKYKRRCSDFGYSPSPDKLQRMCHTCQKRYSEEPPVYNKEIPTIAQNDQSGSDEEYLEAVHGLLFESSQKAPDAFREALENQVFPYVGESPAVEDKEIEDFAKESIEEERKLEAYTVRNSGGSPERKWRSKGAADFALPEPMIQIPPIKNELVTESEEENISESQESFQSAVDFEAYPVNRDEPVKAETPKDVNELILPLSSGTSPDSNEARNIDP